MSREYNDYLKNHIGGVISSAKWLVNNGIFEVLFENEAEAKLWLVLLNKNGHDNTKMRPELYKAYDEYFNGTDESTELVDLNFNMAWLEHQREEPHHWQYWVLIEDSGVVRPMEMEKGALAEMISDWCSFAWNKNRIDEILEFWNDKGPHMLLGDDTRQLIRSIMDRLVEYIDDKGDRFYD